MTTQPASPMRANPALCRERAGVGMAEFVAMVASLMALNALAIDVMLPALTQIGSALGAVDDNQAQLIVVVYVIGFGIPQLIIGPLTDRYGRKPVLLFSLIGYTLAGIGCVVAENFTTLLVWRFLQGVAASGGRVVATSVVRDIFAGRGMARIMSLVMTVFMVIPIIAPSIGQLVLFVAPWRAVFGSLVIGGLIMLIWTGFRLKETLDPDNRSPLSVRGVASAYRQVLGDPMTRGYMLAGGVIFGALFAFITASAQIFQDVFRTGESFPLWFAGIAIAMSAATYTNSMLVERLGMRRLSHGALIGFILFSTLTLLGIWAFGEHLWVFYPPFLLAFACFGLIGSNFNAIAMEPLGRIAGTGSAVFGFATTTLAGTIGGVIASRYSGSSIPILEGYVVLGLATLAIVLIVEKGRLMSSR